MGANGVINALDIDIHTNTRGIPITIYMGLQDFTFGIDGHVMEKGVYTFKRSSYEMLMSVEDIREEMDRLISNNRRNALRWPGGATGASGFSGWSGVSGGPPPPPPVESPAIAAQQPHPRIRIEDSPIAVSPPPITVPRPAPVLTWLQRIVKGDK